MTLDQTLAFFASIAAILTFVGIIVGKLVTAHTNKVVNSLVKDYLSELKPNSGSSMRDEVKTISTGLIELKVDVASLEGKFDQHIRETSH
jgi:hypothetical protein